MNLAMMRDIDAADPIGGLGPRVTPAPTPAPAPVKRGDGFVVGPDGKLSTDLPDPTQEPAPILCKCGLTPAACAMTSCSPSAPWPFPQRACLAPVTLRAGDSVRLIGETIWQPAYLGRIGLVVAADEQLVEIAVDESGIPVRSHLEFEGREWERVA